MHGGPTSAQVAGVKGKRGGPRQRGTQGTQGTGQTAPLRQKSTQGTQGTRGGCNNSSRRSDKEKLMWCNSVRTSKCPFAESCIYLHSDEWAASQLSKTPCVKATAYMARHAAVLRKGYLLDIAAAVALNKFSLTTLAEELEAIGWERYGMQSCEFIGNIVGMAVQTLHFTLQDLSPIYPRTLHLLDTMLGDLPSTWGANRGPLMCAPHLSLAAKRDMLRVHDLVHRDIRVNIKKQVEADLCFDGSRVLRAMLFLAMGPRAEACEEGSWKDATDDVAALMEFPAVPGSAERSQKDAAAVETVEGLASQDDGGVDDAASEGSTVLGWADVSDIEGMEGECPAARSDSASVCASIRTETDGCLSTPPSTSLETALSTQCATEGPEPLDALGDSIPVSLFLDGQASQDSPVEDGLDEYFCCADSETGETDVSGMYLGVF